MPRLTHSIDFAKGSLSAKQVIVVPTRSIYHLATLPSQKDQLQELKYGNQSFRGTYFFQSIKQLLRFTKPLPEEILFLLKALTPGQVMLILPSNGKLSTEPDIACMIPSEPILQELLEAIDQPLLTTSANYTGYPTSTNIDMVEAFFPEVEMILHDDSYSPTIWLDPTIISCLNYPNLEIQRPGIISYQELLPILPKNLTLRKGYQYVKRPGHRKPTPRSQTYNIWSEKPLIMGTKERLRDTFDLKEVSYFSKFETDDFQLFNLGSQTHPESIAKNLYEKLFQASQFSAPIKLILWQNWGESKWGDIIDYTLKKHIDPGYRISQPELIRTKIKQFQMIK